jgi:hypothetical protein
MIGIVVGFLIGLVFGISRYALLKASLRDSKFAAKLTSKQFKNAWDFSKIQDEVSDGHS